MAVRSGTREPETQMGEAGRCRDGGGCCRRGGWCRCGWDFDVGHLAGHGPRQRHASRRCTMAALRHVCLARRTELCQLRVRLPLRRVPGPCVARLFQDAPDKMKVVARCPRCGEYREAGLQLTGDDAQRTLRRVLAYHHFAGASEPRVFKATRLIQEAGSPQIWRGSSSRTESGWAISVARGASRSRSR